jgi:hypothetical protein
MADAGCNHIFGRYPSTAHAIWRATGDRGVISRHLANIVRYVESLATGVRRTGLANMHTKYGDWLPPPEAPTPSKPLCSAAAFIHDLGLVEEMAAAIGNTTVAARVPAAVVDGFRFQRHLAAKRHLRIRPADGARLAALARDRARFRTRRRDRQSRAGDRGARVARDDGDCGDASAVRGAWADRPNRRCAPAPHTDEL